MPTASGTVPGRQLCRKHQQGRCKMGSHCQYLHIPPSTEPIIKNAQASKNDASVASTSYMEPCAESKNGLNSRARIKACRRKHKIHPSIDYGSDPSPFTDAISGPSHAHPVERRGGEALPTTVLTSAQDQPRRSTARKTIERCRDFARGRCHRGDSCCFVHELQAKETSTNQQPESGRARYKARNVELDAAVRAKQEAGRQEAIRPALEAEAAARHAKEGTQKEAARWFEQLAASNAWRIQRDFQKVEIWKVENAKTAQHITLGSLITFGAGLAIHDTLTGFESCRIRVKNLPPDAKMNEVYDLFAQQGLDVGKFFITGMKRALDGTQEANIVGDAEAGKLLAIGMDGVEFRDKKLRFEMSQDGNIEGKGASARAPGNTLIISWMAPSVCMVAEYTDMSYAEARARELDGGICGGRRVRVEMNRLPAGRVMPSFCPTSIKISGLPVWISESDVTAFSRSFSLKTLRTTDYEVDGALRNLRLHLETHSDGGLREFQRVATDVADSDIIVRARFDSWIQAKKVHDSLANQRFPYIGGSSFRLRLFQPLQYTIVMPVAQYSAQIKQWKSLQESATDDKVCSLRINTHDKVFVNVMGKDKKAVGSLKVRAENLAAGAQLDAWHRSLGFETGRQFLVSVNRATGAYVRFDGKLQALRVYGSPNAIQRARAMVEAEVARLASLETTVRLKRRSVGFFVRHGVAALKEICGEDGVTLEVSEHPCKITITGGEDARHALHSLIAESISEVNAVQRPENGNTCPICYDDVCSPVQLSCGHVYCTACISHLLKTAPDTKKFPLTCLGDDAKCAHPIPIPTMQRFLSPPQFNRLLDVVFKTYLEQHPHEFKYCKTPDCIQIYRCASAPPILNCPSCFSTVCTSCHEEAHEGMSCAERKVLNDPAEQERLNEVWAAEQGVKRCPSCSVWIEKTAGCNHMQCKCGAHICWKCMSLFPAAEIYDHMRKVHGGIDDDVNEAHFPVPEPIRQPPEMGRRPIYLGLEPDERLAIELALDGRPERQRRLTQQWPRPLERLLIMEEQRQVREQIFAQQEQEQRQRQEQEQEQRRGGCVIM